MVSVIILSYNTMQLLDNCLSSLYRSLSGLQFEIIVVDNNSKDQSVAMIKNKFPKVRLIENEENVGFARGVNQGASEAKGEYLLLLNSDANMQNRSFHDMLEFLNKKDDIGIIGGQLENADGSTSKSYGSFYSLQQVCKMLFFDSKEVSSEVKHAGPVDWVSGGYMLIRHDAFTKLGGFDTHFFMYMEDMELCYRAKKHKIQVWFFPEAVATHRGQGSSNRSFAVIQIYKGLKYFYKKHKSLPEYVILSGLLMTKSVVAMIVGILTGNSYLTKTYGKAFRVAL